MVQNVLRSTTHGVDCVGPVSPGSGAVSGRQSVDGINRRSNLSCLRWGGDMTVAVRKVFDQFM